MFVWWKENGRIDDEINWNKETFGTVLEGNIWICNSMEEE